jgi:hypothetical protein
MEDKLEGWRTADLENWIPWNLPDQPKLMSHLTSKGQTSRGRDKGCVLKAAVTETQVRTFWQRRLSVFSTECGTGPSLLSQSPYQTSRNLAAVKAKNRASSGCGKQSDAGRLSSKQSSPYPVAARVLTGYRRQCSGQADRHCGRAPVTFNRKIASSGYGV